MVIHGDCLEELKKLPDCSVDLVCTDPPYFLINDSGHGFMGKAWDGILHLWNYLWLDDEFARFAEQFFLATLLEKNMDGDATAPASASTEPHAAERSESALPATDHSRYSSALKRDFARPLVLTKGELLDLFNVVSLGGIGQKLLNGVSDNARFVLPLSLLKEKLTTGAAASALNSLTKLTCAGPEIRLSLTDAAKISGAIVGTIGRSSGARSMSEMVGLASFAASTAGAEKFSATTVNVTDRAALMKCLTLLLFALNATRSSKETQYSLIDNFFTRAEKRLKNGTCERLCLTSTAPTAASNPSPQ